MKGIDVYGCMLRWYDTTCLDGFRSSELKKKRLLKWFTKLKIMMFCQGASVQVMSGALILEDHASRNII